MADRSVTAQIKLLFSAQSMGAMQQAMRNMVNSLNRVEESIEQANVAFGTLGDTGAAMVEIAESFLNPLQQASSAYVQRFGMMEQTSARWIQSTMRLEQAQIKMGRAATQALQPLQDKLVTIIEKVADFVDKNPELLQMAVGVGGTLLAAGTAIAGISKAVLMINQLRSSIMALNAMGGLAGGLGAAGVLVGGMAMAPTVGMAAGKLAGRAIGGEFAGEAVQGQEFVDVLRTATIGVAAAITSLSKPIILLATYASAAGLALADLDKVIQYGLGLISREEYDRILAENNEQAVEYGRQLVAEFSYIVGGIADLGDRIPDRPGGTGTGGSGPPGIDTGITQEMLDQYEMYLYEMEQAQQQFEYQSEIQAQEHGRQMLLMDEDFKRQMRQAADDFARDRQQSLDDFNERLLLSERDFNIEAAQAEGDFHRDEMRRLKDYQLERKRAEEDHKRSLLDAAARLDALAVIQEQRQYAIDSTRSKQDFDRETQLNKENFGRQQALARENYDRQIADMRNSFATQQRIAQENYDIQRKRAEEEYQIQAKRAQDEYARQIAMQKQQFDRERQLRDQAYKQQIEMQLRQYTMTAQQSEAHYADMRSRFTGFLSGIKSDIDSLSKEIEKEKEKKKKREYTGNLTGYTPPNYQTGGYVAGGLANLHPGEFVLTPGTTRALERQLGGSLTQAGVVRAGGGNQILMSVANTFNDVGSHSIDSLTGMVKTATREALVGLLRDYTGEA